MTSGVSKNYLSFIDYYDEAFTKYGDVPQGFNWPKPEDMPKRFDVMLDLIAHHDRQGSACSLLDFGCGGAHLLEYMKNNGIDNIDYSGLDLYEKFVELCRKKYPTNQFLCLDVLESPDSLPEFDYCVMNGVFTVKGDLSFAEMFDYFCRVLKIVFSKCRKGIAFNVMSKHVDWERDDLFHVPFDALASFLTKGLTRHFVFRNDYGLYEYTTYVYKTPTFRPSAE